jgi:hypothetical protein
MTGVAYIFTLDNEEAGHREADVGVDMAADIARTLDRAYEFPPHRGRQFNRPDVRRSDESQEGEEY